MASVTTGEQALMPIATRHVVLIAVAVLCVAAAKTPAENLPAGTHPVNSGPTVVRSAKTVTAAKLVAVAPTDHGCPRDRERRDSELCAAWKSADASSDAATWARWSFWLALAGTIGVLVTLHYTRKAVLAAETATQDAASAIDVAERNATAAAAAARAMERQNELMSAAQRPWLSFELASVGPVWRIAEGSFCLAYDIVVRNTGTAPAVFVRPHAGRALVTNGIDIDPAAFVEQAAPLEKLSFSALGPGDTLRFTDNPFIYGLGVDREGFVPGETFPTYWIGVVYRDQVGGGPYCTVHHFGLFGDIVKDGIGEASFKPGYQGFKTLMN